MLRRFRREAAEHEVLDHARRGAVLFMDGDGQHPPDLVEKLVGHWIEDGYDVVYTAKAHRANEPALRRLGGRMFYALLNWGSRHKIPEDAGDFRLLSHDCLTALNSMRETHRFLRGMVAWIGGKQVPIAYDRKARDLARLFADNFATRFADVGDAIRTAGPTP